MAQQLMGKAVVDAVAEKLQATVDELRGKGIVPKLAIVRVGERGDDIAYERSAMKRMEALGIEVENVRLPEDVSQGDLEEAFCKVNEDKKVHGIMIFQPLPKHLSAKPLVDMIHPVKDVDGISPLNVAKILPAMLMVWHHVRRRHAWKSLLIMALTSPASVWLLWGAVWL